MIDAVEMKNYDEIPAAAPHAQSNPPLWYGGDEFPAIGRAASTIAQGCLIGHNLGEWIRRRFSSAKSWLCFSGADSGFSDVATESGNDHEGGEETATCPL